MATNHTENYELSQWLATGQVQRTDFNADNANIDAALMLRNCCTYQTTYIGDGNQTRTHVFPRKPVLVLIIGGGAPTFAVYGAEKGYCILGASSSSTPTLSWTENSLTITTTSPLASYIANASGETYMICSILNLE